MMSKQSLAADIIDGAIAGAIATWIMGKATTALYEGENQSARQEEDQARHGKTAYGVAAEKAASLAGLELSDEQRKKAGQAIHWALGIGAGALFGALRPRSEIASAAGGLLFGAAFWLLMDETVTPALGLTPGPTAFPWQTHARGLAGHLVFGTVANTTLATIQPAA
ncbi:MAG: DUF1440 domain-containing protein [Gemmatimonadaceae bacterium]|nr:DUF1440 domain-containing protein [Gemmatimonadaceae bacterium]